MNQEIGFPLKSERERSTHWFLRKPNYDKDVDVL